MRGENQLNSRSMKDCISQSDVANEVSMMRSSFGGTVLIVEGVSDARLYTKFIDRENVKILIAHSKNNVLETVSTLRNRRGDGSVIGFVDKDMDGMLGKRRNPPIFATDRRDVESTILSSPALNDVLAECGDTEKIRSFVAKYGEVSESLAKAACPIGLLMYISYRKGMNLSFKDIDHLKYVSTVSLKPDIPRLVANIFASSMPQRYSRGSITEQLRPAAEECGASWDIARGHDAVAVLRIALRYTFGSYNCRNITDGEVGGALRLAYSRQYFGTSELFKDSSEWCRNNGLVLWN